MVVSLLSFGVFTQEKKKENEKAQYLCGLQGKVFFKGKTKQNHLSEIWGKIKARKRAGMGDQKPRKTRPGKRQSKREHIKIS
tara:strand:+ start:272 stop:517 length:246 start_codon:yes stop_codon:yes gene_type:complete